MTERVTPKALEDAYLDGYRRGYRRGLIEARAELTALWRGRVADVLTILQAPIPNPSSKDNK